MTTIGGKRVRNAVERAYVQGIWWRNELTMSGGREEVPRGRRSLDLDRHQQHVLPLISVFSSDVLALALAFWLWLGLGKSQARPGPNFWLWPGFGLAWLKPWLLAGKSA